MRENYSRRDSDTLKGIAVLLLLFHHFFYRGYPFSLYLIKDPDTYFQPVVKMARVCVFLFLFVSGLGMYRAFDSRIRKSSHVFKTTLRFEASHILKFYQMFWFIYLIFVPLGFFFHRSPVKVYSGRISHMLLDFFGLSYLTEHPTFVGSWWFNGILLFVYVLLPIIYLLLKKLPRLITLLLLLCLITAATVVPGTRRLSYIVDILPFILGAYAGRYEWMEKAREFLSGGRKSQSFRLFLLLSLMTGYIVLRILFLEKRSLSYRMDWIPMFLLAFAADEYLPKKENAASTFLQTLGSNSGNIYLFHGFLYSLYFKDYFYFLKYAPLVYVFGIALCLLLSRILESLKDLTGYNKAFKSLHRKLDGGRNKNS